MDSARVYSICNTADANDADWIGCHWSDQMIETWITLMNAKSRRVKSMLPWLWKSVLPYLELCGLNDATSIPAKDITVRIHILTKFALKLLCVVWWNEQRAEFPTSQRLGSFKVFYQVWINRLTCHYSKALLAEWRRTITSLLCLMWSGKMNSRLEDVSLMKLIWSICIVWQPCAVTKAYIDSIATFKVRDLASGF